MPNVMCYLKSRLNAFHICKIKLFITNIMFMSSESKCVLNAFFKSCLRSAPVRYPCSTTNVSQSTQLAVMGNGVEEGC